MVSSELPANSTTRRGMPGPVSVKAQTATPSAPAIARPARSTTTRRTSDCAAAGCAATSRVPIHVSPASTSASG